MKESNKKKFLAIIRKLDADRGFKINANEIKTKINSLKSDQKKISQIKEENKNVAVVVEEADKSQKKLQTIINDLNDYMSVLQTEGLLDYGSGEATPMGKS